MLKFVRHLTGNTIFYNNVKTEILPQFRGQRIHSQMWDDLSEEEVILTMEYASDLQRNLDITYSKIYLSLIDKLYVCDLSDVDRIKHKTHCTSYDISPKMCKEFFIKSL